jgi:hypothetical protein
MNILQLSLLLTILFKCVVASENGVAQDVIDALGEPGFGRIRNGWWKWRDRKNLFDYVITKDVVFIAAFINRVRVLKIPTLAALFIKRSDEVDQVLEKIEYTDVDLIYLTEHRPELAESHGTFFKAIDKIKNPEYQESAVKVGVSNLFNAKKHDSVIPLIDALENRKFNGRILENVAIQQALMSGAWGGIKNIVERLHEHSAITFKEYVNGLRLSWNNDKSEVFRFLLDQADKDDLVEAKRTNRYNQDEKFRKAIDEATSALSKDPSRVSRHARPAERAERVRLAMKTFSGIQGLEPLGKKDTLGGIISGYILG